jgi:NAD(P)-dependent dehydrogenase (short-subunit alcohol dehydrogenase family)
MGNRLVDRVVLVTGGGSGLGRAVVDRFLTEGAKVGVLERNLSRVEELENEYSDSVVCTVGDVSSADDNVRAVTATVEKFGQLDVFVGNAGVYDHRASLESLSMGQIDAAFRELFDINVKGFLLGSKSAIPELRKAKAPSIIFTASVSSVSAGFGGSLYVAAKHAVAGMTRQLAYELAPRIRVNAVAPGYVPTQLGGLESLDASGVKSNPGLSALDLPLQVLPTPYDFTSIYLLLASGESSVMTGSVILADGGTSIWGPGPAVR